MFRKNNLIGDVLSQIPEINISAALNFSAIAAAQKDDAVVQSLKSESKYTFKKFPIFGSLSSICCELSEKEPRQCIPATFRMVAFRSVHDFGHP